MENRAHCNQEEIDYREWPEMFNSKKQPVSLFESGV